MPAHMRVRYSSTASGGAILLLEPGSGGVVASIAVPPGMEPSHAREFAKSIMNSVGVEGRDDPLSEDLDEQETPEEKAERLRRRQERRSQRGEDAEKKSLDDKWKSIQAKTGADPNKPSQDEPTGQPAKGLPGEVGQLNNARSIPGADDGGRTPLTTGTGSSEQEKSDAERAERQRERERIAAEEAARAHASVAAAQPNATAPGRAAAATAAQASAAQSAQRSHDNPPGKPRVETHTPQSKR